MENDLILMQIAEKKLEIAKVSSQLKILEAELEVLNLRNKGKKPTIEVANLLQEKPKELTEIYKDHIELDKLINYYVVHRGPKMGIHKNRKVIQDLPAEYYKICQGREEAERYLKHKKELTTRATLQIKMSRNLALPHEVMSSALTTQWPDKNTWINLYNEMTCLDQETDFMYPVQRGGTVKMIVLPEASPARVYQFFQAGLIDTIYPDNQLEVLQGFPSGLTRALQTYMQRVKIIDKSIFMRIHSSIPEWTDEGKTFAGYHLIKIGTAGEFKNPEPVFLGHDVPKEEDIRARLLGDYEKIVTETCMITEETYIKVNYGYGQIIIYSNFNKPLSGREHDMIRVFAKDVSNKLAILAKKEKENPIIQKGGYSSDDDIMDDDAKEAVE